jgi:hypothetical protein
MNEKIISNIAASVHQRLLNKARADKRPFNELLQYFCMERFLFRLMSSQYADAFVLKGALMLKIWNIALNRPTMDIDMLGQISNDETVILTMLQNVLQTEVIPDGISFDISSIVTERIAEDAKYEGIRLRFCAYLGNARINMQIDIGFSDTVYPMPLLVNYPVILDFPSPRLLCYSKESVVAEKFEIMVSLGILNSRMKDFFDIWSISRQFEFNGHILQEAIIKTFENRNTILPENIDAFTENFALEKQLQWKAFKNRLSQEHLPENFADIVKELKEFLGPIALTIYECKSFNATWNSPGSWVFIQKNE